MPYADQPTAGAACDIDPSPNGNDADATINVTSHEHNEAITDPLGNAWYDSGGYENADKCAWTFGTPRGSTQFGAVQPGDRSGQVHAPAGVEQRTLDLRPDAIILPPKVTSFLPQRGRAGVSITLNGQNLAGASSVQLRGVPATFAVVDATKITARVPAGVSGLAKWTVKTPGGTATSAYFCAC